MKYLLESGACPPNRLAVGIPLYGRGFRRRRAVRLHKERTAQDSRPRGQLQPTSTSSQREGLDPRWDDETKNPWLIAPDRSAVIGYDDAESVAIKTEWAMKQGFRGVFFWEIGGDLLPDGTNLLQDAAHHKWANSPLRKP